MRAIQEKWSRERGSKGTNIFSRLVDGKFMTLPKNGRNTLYMEVKLEVASNTVDK